ncbi:hypothetical protein BC940DRAFT_259332 [Gongronella butleri]|nr:hypothetical protein BC940DRAFT_259332 [Gongronella butleri]
MASPQENTPLLAPPVTAATSAQQDSKKEFVGLVIMAVSALAFSTMSLMVSITGRAFPSFEIVVARSIIQAVLGLVGCAWLGINPLGARKVRYWLVLRGSAGAVGLALFFYSLTKLPLADATVVFFLGPVFTAILASIALHEPFTPFDMVCSVVSMAGIVFVSKPQFLFGDVSIDSWERLFAIFCALMGAVLSAVAYVTVRRVGKGAHFLVHVVYFGFISLIMSGVGLVLWQEYVPPSGWTEYGGLTLVGILAFFGQCLLNKGYKKRGNESKNKRKRRQWDPIDTFLYFCSLQLAPAGKGTIMRNADVVFAFLFGIFILGEIPDAWSVTGALLIVGSTTSLGLHKWLASRR